MLGRGTWRRLAACVLASRDDEPVGAAILNLRDAPTRPAPIAWVTELFRIPDPALRGLGGVLLDHAVLAARRAGVPAVGLVVTAGNPAQRVYEQRGFRVVQEARTVVLPS